MKKEHQILHELDHGIRLVENLGVGFSFACIVLIVSVSVFCRYVLKSGIMWSAEIQEVLVVAMAMFGCAKATREGGHTELTSLTKHLPRKGRIFLRAITSMAAFVFFAIFFFTSVKYTVTTGNLKTIMLKIPYRYFYMFLPIGMGLNLYEFVKRIPERIMKDPPEEY